MTDGFQHRRAPIVKKVRTTPGRVIFAATMSCIGMIPIALVGLSATGFPSMISVLGLIPAIAFGSTLFYVAAFVDPKKQGQSEDTGVFMNESFPHDPTYSAAYQLRNEPIRFE